MSSEKVIDPDQTVIEQGDDDHIEEEGGDNPEQPVSDETDKVVPLKALTEVEKKYQAERDARKESERAFNELM